MVILDKIKKFGLLNTNFVIFFFFLLQKYSVKTFWLQRKGLTTVNAF